MNNNNNKHKLWSARKMHFLHGWMGFKLNILMFVICLTGALAVVSHEIDWLINPNMRVEAQQTDIAWQAMYDNAKKEFPNSIISSIKAPLYQNFASVGLAVHPNYGARRLIFNPYTGELIETRHWYASAQRILRDVHRYLLYPAFGIYIVGWFGFILLGLVISSLFVYKKWWRGFFSFRRGKGWRVFMRELHKLIGVWSIWFFLLIAITGIWYLVEAGIRDAGIDIQMSRPNVELAYLQQAGPKPKVISVGDVLNITQQEMPDLEIKGIGFPLKTNSPYLITGQTNSWWVRDRANHIFINPFNGEVLKKQYAEQQGALSYWIDMADPLHFGSFGGLTIKIIWFLFGLTLPIMSATGTWIWLNRNKKHIESNDTKSSRPYRLWIFKPLSIAIILIGLISGSALMIYMSYQAGTPEEVQIVDEKMVGPWRVQLKSNIPTSKQPIEKFMMIVNCDQCTANYETASIAWGSLGGALPLSFTNFKQGRSPYIGIPSVKVTHSSQQQSVLTMKITDHQGNSFFEEFDLPK